MKQDSLRTESSILPKLLFVAGLAFVCLTWVAPPVALALGVIFGLTMRHPFRLLSHSLSNKLLQASVVGLGFSMDLREVLNVGRRGLLYTFLSITFVMIIGLVLGRTLRVSRTNSFLIAVGTAICGGSAIAAVGPIVEATDEEMSASLSTVFILNSAALMLFPAIGMAVGLTQEQFGLWAALAIHDTSSVVGAGMKFGAGALAAATMVKLTRALWIVPVALATAIAKQSQARAMVPWFILLFVVATIVNTYLPIGAPLYNRAAVWSKTGLIAALYLIGSNISRATLKAVGLRPLMQGSLLWIVVAWSSLWLIYFSLIVL